MTNNKSQILVSIVCITYNHEPYLRQTLDSFLMQKTSFAYEIVLAEDCSTDGTRKICEEYAAKYPDMIHYIYRDHNVGYNENEYEAMNSAKGKYIAYCEGDDYWTISDKLQKQVDFLESHPEYSVCWHRCIHHNVSTGMDGDDACGRILGKYAEGIDIDMDTYFAKWYTQPLTMVFRKNALDLSLYLSYKYFRDMQQMYHILKNGKGYLFAFNGGIRNVHDGGMASKITPKQYCDISLPIDREFFWKNLDKGPKKNYIGTLDTCVKVYAQCNKWKAIYCALVRFIISGHPHSLWRNFKLIANSK